MNHLWTDDMGGAWSIDGCTDPNALNYNEMANFDDGSCQYSEQDPCYPLEMCQDAYGPGTYACTQLGECANLLELTGGLGSIEEVNLYPDPESCFTAGGIWENDNCIFPFVQEEDYEEGGEEGGEEGEEVGCTDPDANNFNPDATIDDGSCTYDSDDGEDPSEEPAYAESNLATCVQQGFAGQHFYDSQSRQLRYCPQSIEGQYGEILSEYQRGGEGWETGLGESEEWSPYQEDLSGLWGEEGIFGGQRNIFDVLPPEVLQNVPPEYWSEIGGTYGMFQEKPEWESLLGNLKGIRTDIGTERRGLQESLREMSLYGGTSQSFAGAGGGVMPGRARAGAVRTFEDFMGEQSMERAGYESGFEEDITGLRSSWEEDILSGYADLLGRNPTQMCTTCAEGEICMSSTGDGNDECVPYDQVDWTTLSASYLG